MTKKDIAMERVGPRALIVQSGDLKYGWTFAQQVSKNPKAKKACPDLRQQMAKEKYRTRTNQHIARFQKGRNPKELDSARYTQRKEE